MDDFVDVYETMLGLREPEAQISGIEDAFGEGQICSLAYGEMRAAYERICLRLGTSDEDHDLDIMVESFETIQKDLCRRMFLLKHKQ